MKRVFVLIFVFALTACTTPTVTLVPVDTAVAMTQTAMPKIDSPTPPPSDTPVPPTETATPTPPTEFDVTAPGAYCIPVSTKRERGLVTRVLDGATVEVSIGGVTHRVKYIGLKAPAIGLESEWQAPQAFAANEGLVAGRPIILVKDISEEDAEGYLLRYVISDNIFVNYEIARLGYAQVLIIPPDTVCQTALMAAQKEAHDTVSGIWAATPTPSPTITLTPTNTKPAPTATFTLPPPCSCERRYTCSDFSTQASAQACYNYCTVQRNIFIGLRDKSGNGRVCEGLP